jgi:hypothetical protein
MDQTLSLGWMQGDARTRRAGYQRILCLTLIAEAVVGLAALVAPSCFSSLLGLPAMAEMPASTVWARAWGVTVLIVAMFQIPALREPVRHRWGNVIGILGRLLLGLLFLLIGICVSGGVLWLALLEGGLGLALAIRYFGLFRAELMSRP